MPVTQLHRVVIDDPYLFLEVKLLSFNTVVLGYSSRLKQEYQGHSNWHVGLFDTRPLMPSELRAMSVRLHDAWPMYDFYIFRSTKGKDSYHVICPCYMTVWVVMRINNSLYPWLDTKFYGLGLTRGFWDLRITTKGTKQSKITFVEGVIAKSDSEERLSGAHLKILEMMGVSESQMPHKWQQRSDGEIKVELYRYSI